MYKTKGEKKDRGRWLQTRLETLLKNEEVQAYIKWKKLPEEVKSSLRNSWRIYYEKCRMSPQALKFFEMKEAFNNKNYGLVQKLREEAKIIKQSEITVPKPSSIDPQMFMTQHLCQDYDRVMEELDSGNVIMDSKDLFN